MLGNRPADERGQLLIVTALALATALVALALVLNSAIYTENLSTRESTDSAGVTGAIEGGHADIETAIRHVNLNDNDSQASVNQAFDDITAELRTVSTNRHARSGASYHFVIRDRTNGVHLQHTNESKSFVSATGEGDWQLTTAAPRLRGYTMTVAIEDLYTSTEELESLLDNAFYIELNDGGTVWEIYIYENDAENIVVAGNEASEFEGLDNLDDLMGMDTTCEVDATSVDIDFNANTLNGDQHCPGLEFEESLSGDLAINYTNADDHDSTNQSRSGGTYELVIGTTDYETTNFDNTEEEPFESPFAAHVIYDINVETSYSRSDIDHDRSVRIAPGDEEYIG